MDQEHIKVSQPSPMQPCKICGTESPLYGAVDFNKNCEEWRGRLLPESKVSVGYNRCPRCGFLFSSAFDGWGHAEFLDAVYNDNYKLVDPDYAASRPAANAEVITKAFWSVRESLTVLDYGGGNGLLAETLLKNGFLSAETYDPFDQRFATWSGGRFNVVTCFETLEHVPNPTHEIARIASCVADEGIVIFSTLVQPVDFDRIGLSWWYLAPRNGHISLFTRNALVEVWRQQGFNAISFSDSTHAAFRTIPGFARHLPIK
jgi:2-polyprenyl-6-hydroxyphenyl methylase/3-demethylubiquinone-9 3-methyltransferase